MPRSRFVEVEERLDAFGAGVKSLTPCEVADAAEALATLEPDAVAVSLAFSYLDPVHEEMIEQAFNARLAEVPVVQL